MIVVDSHLAELDMYLPLEALQQAIVSMHDDTTCLLAVTSEKAVKMCDACLMSQFLYQTCAAQMKSYMV